MFPRYAASAAGCIRSKRSRASWSGTRSPASATAVGRRVRRLEERQVARRGSRRRHHDHQPLDRRCAARGRCPASDSRCSTRHRLRRRTLRPPAVLARELRHEVLGEQRDVVAARSRSGGTKIGTTFSRKYRSSRNRPARTSAGRSLLVAATTRTSTLIRGVPADRLDDLLLQHAQHLGLRLQAHVADLVEEDRAAVGRLEHAAPLGHRAGERAALVAEQLALDQLLGNRRAVDLDERAVPPAAARVDRGARPAPCRCRSRR